MKKVSSRELARRTRPIIDDMLFKGEIYCMTRKGAPVGIILPIPKYKLLLKAYKQQREKG